MRLRLFVGALAFLIAGCDDATGPNVSGLDPLAIARIEIVPQLDTLVVQDTLSPGDTLRLRAAVVLRSGGVLTDVQLAWQSSDPAVAVVGPTGLVLATGYGTATITASAGKTATAQVVVIPAFPADTVANRVAVDMDGAIAVGGETTCVRTDRLRIFCSGENFDRELGSAGRDMVCSDAYGQANERDEMIPCSLVPLRVDSPLRLASVVLGEDHGCALDLAGTAICWGRSDSGQVGNGRAATQVPPTIVSGVHQFRSLTAGYAHTCGIATDGAAWCWGLDAHGQLGGERLAAWSTTPIPVDGGRTDWAQLSAGDRHSCGVTTGGQAFCWGDGAAGQLGNGTVLGSLKPVAVLGGLSFTAVAAGGDVSCGIVQNGTVYCWGDDSLGQLGRDALNSASAVPVLVDGGGGFTAIAAGGQLVCGLRNGAAVCWGSYDLNNQGTQSAGTRPTPVSGAPPFARIEVGRRHACGVTEAGEAHCWGSNVFGPFGDGLQALWRPTPQRFLLPSH